MESVKQAGKNSPPDSAILRVIGRDGSLEFTLDEILPFEQLVKGLRKYLSKVKDRFEGGKVTLNLGDRLLSVEELEEIWHLLEDDYRLILMGISSGVEALRHLLLNRASMPAETPLETPVSMDDLPDEIRKAPTIKAPDSEAKTLGGQDTLLVRGTCRSGTTIHNYGNVVVAGDVNPGAEVTATKDIYIFGKLSGLAHAGVSGDEDAVILALQFAAHQLRVGTHIKMDPPTESQDSSLNPPRMALVKGNTIVIEPFTARSIWKPEE